MPLCLKYEKHNDSLQEAIEQISAKDQNCDNTVHEIGAIPACSCPIIGQGS